MSDLLLILIPLWPLLLLPAVLAGGARAWLLPLAALPALVGALLVPVGSALQLPWLLLGVHLALDGTGQLFLLFSALIWLAAGVHAAARGTAQQPRGGFAPSFLLAMAGNLLLVLAADMVSFYLGFAAMGLAAYGMLIQPRSQRARFAARLYLGFALVGEVALFAGIVVLAAAGDSLLFADLAGQTPPTAALVLLLLGFGIKVALPGLHLWLPLAYAAAPIAAAAVLSGPMMKAGLLGWLRFLPPGGPGLEDWGTLLLVLGGLGVALGTLAGLAQRDPRALLGYSSIAKMGLMTAVFGVALGGAADGAAITGALLLFAMHHLLVKPALFLGLDEWERRGPRPWVLAGLGLLALAMAGLPLTGGAAAKAALTDALVGELAVLFALSAIGTTLLMIRFLSLLTGTAPDRPAPANDAATLAWLGVLPFALWGPFRPTELAFAWDGLAPIAAGLAIAAAAAWLLRRRPGWRVAIAPGDLLWPLRRAAQSAGGALAASWPILRLPEMPVRWVGAPGPHDAEDAGRGTAGPAPAPGTLIGAGLRWLAVWLLLLAAVLAPS